MPCRWQASEKSAAAVFCAPVGVENGGYEQLLIWARTHGTVQRAAIECTSSNGTALTRHLHDRGINVIEVNHPTEPRAAKAARRTPSTPKPPPRGPGRSRNHRSKDDQRCS